MPKRNLFAKLNNPSSDIPLRPFDLSQRKLYSSRAGMCVPTLALECVKGDKFKINPTVFNRTDRLLAPAFFRCKQFYHFFFVPYHTLWHEWDSFFTRSTEKLSSATLGNSYFPNLDIDDFRHVVSSQTSLGTDMMGYATLPGIDRMMQMLHYDGFNNWNDADWPNQGSHYVNLSRILAYNKIWYWFYRDKRHSPSSSWFQDFVKYYNVDDVNCSTFANSHISPSTELPRLLEMFKPKYRTWDSDVFTNSFTSTQFGNVSVVNADNVQIYNNAIFDSSVAQSDYNITVYRANANEQNMRAAIKNSSTGALKSGSNLWNIPNLFDILALRRAEAVQHWRELMLRAGDSSKDRYRAMFGTNPKRSEEIPNYIGGFDVNLNIDDVTSNSIDNGQSVNGLGQLAGKGIMLSQNNEIEFTSPDYGVLMCISSILPLSEYDGDCIDKANQLVEPTDFYIPQFDRLGFEPITLGEWTTAHSVYGTYYDPNIVVGYTVRNHYLKTAVDRVYNNFRYGKSENFWTCVRNPMHVANPNISYVLGYRQYYVSPDVVNPLFDRHPDPSTTSPDSAYNEDQFKCMVYFDIKALRPMSELGLPPL